LMSVLFCYEFVGRVSTRQIFDTLALSRVQCDLLGKRS
jgi:hypothetical protein